MRSFQAMSIATLLTISVCPSTLCSQERDVSAKLDTAKIQYASDIESARNKLVTAMDSSYEKAAANGKLDVKAQIALVEKIDSERTALLLDPNSIPDIPDLRVAVATYQSARDRAKSKCAKEFENAAKKYQRNRDFAAAKSVLDEKELFFLDSTSKSAEPIQKGTVWEGEGVILTSGSAYGPIKFTILERDGKIFRARYETPRDLREVTGTIETNQLQWYAGDSRNLRGEAGPDTRGMITGQRILLECIRSSTTGAVVTNRAQLRLKQVENK